MKFSPNSNIQGSLHCLALNSLHIFRFFIFVLELDDSFEFCLQFFREFILVWRRRARQNSCPHALHGNFHEKISQSRNEIRLKKISEISEITRQINGK